jgi:hypothetical protein
MAFMQLALGVLALAWPALAASSYDLAFSTYFGGTEWEHARDVFADASGNVYVVGGTASPDFPTGSPGYKVTRGTLQRVFAGGNTDRAVTKLSPTSALNASYAAPWSVCPLF